MIRRLALIWGGGILLFAGLMLLAQDKPKLPERSVAETKALSDLESEKQQHFQAIQQIQQAEGAILADFAKEHPGWHLKTSDFSVEKDEPKKPEVKK